MNIYEGSVAQGDGRLVEGVERDDATRWGMALSTAEVECKDI